MQIITEHVANSCCLFNGAGVGTNLICFRLGFQVYQILNIQIGGMKSGHGLSESCI